MDSRLLTLFITLANTLHFARAAKACHMTPSAVSRAVQRLEDQLGTVLFIRDNRSVQLTPAGELFRVYAVDAKSRWESLQQELKLASKSLEGELRIYCSVTASYSILASILPTFRQRYPGIEIKLHTGDQADAIPRVLSGEEDLSIAAHPGSLSKKISFQTITYTPLRFIGPATECQVSQKVLKMLSVEKTLDWKSLPLIVSEHGLARKRLDAWLKDVGVKPDIYAYVSGHEAIVSMVGLGFGVGLVPELVIQNSPLKEKVRVLPVEPDIEPFHIGVCVLHQRLLSPLVSAFWQVTSELVAR